MNVSLLTGSLDRIYKNDTSDPRNPDLADNYEISIIDENNDQSTDIYINMLHNVSDNQIFNGSSDLLGMLHYILSKLMQTLSKMSEDNSKNALSETIERIKIAGFQEDKMRDAASSQFYGNIVSSVLTLAGGVSSGVTAGLNGSKLSRIARMDAESSGNTIKQLHHAIDQTSMKGQMINSALSSAGGTGKALGDFDHQNESADARRIGANRGLADARSTQDSSMAEKQNQMAADLIEKLSRISELLIKSSVPILR